jgi:hypothetical protein|nr:MAG TPA: hypothetical protein [Bacteriophage sp.]
MELKKMTGGASVDVDELTATPEKVLENAEFLGHGTEEPQSGTMPDLSSAKGSPTIDAGQGDVPAHRAAQIAAARNSEGEVQIALSPPWGCYPGDGRAFVCCKPEELGIDPENIPAGKTICLIEGTWGADADFSDVDLREGKVAYGPDGRVIGSGVNCGTVSKILSAGEEYSVQMGFYDGGKVVAKDLKSQTPGNLEEDTTLAGTGGWSNGKKVNGKAANRGGSQVSKNAYWHNHTDGKIYLINWMPGGFYSGWQNSSGTMCAEVWLEKKYVDSLIGKACISAFSARGFGSGTSEGYQEQSFTMPRDGMVYYGGGAASYGNRGSTCEIRKNGVVIDSRNIDSGNSYAWRGTMFNKSFAAKKGDVIKVIADCWAGTHAMADIQATIVY